MLCQILEPGIDVQCEDEHMQISIERKHFSQLQIGRFHLRYRNCQATGLNQTHMSFRTALNDCGTTHNESESTISYWNEIQAQIVTPGGVISRMHEVSIPFYCVYSKKKLVSGASYKPRRVVFAPEGEGRFIQCDHTVKPGAAKIRFSAVWSPRFQSAVPTQVDAPNSRAAFIARINGLCKT